MKNVRPNHQSAWLQCFNRLMFIREGVYKDKKRIKTFNTRRWHTSEPLPTHQSPDFFFTHLFVKFFAGLFNRHYTVLKSECAIKWKRIFHQRRTSLKNQILAWYFVIHLIEHKVFVATTSAGSDLCISRVNLKTTK